MRCLQCSKKIGFVRRLVDRQFCCDGHRKRARQVYSARVARDLHYEESIEEGWLGKAGSASPAAKSGSAFGPGSGVLLVVLSTLMVMFLPSTPAPDGKGVQSYLPPVSGLTDRLSRAFPSSRSTVALREDFRFDMRNWQSAVSGFSGGWGKVGSAMRVGELRLWKPTLALSDYNIEFAGQIENRALSWAFRAKDQRNYYATKIAINRGEGGVGSGGRAEIVRYTMFNGTAVNRVALPIPVTAIGNMMYEVKMRVRGDRFTTMVNGQAVDSWTDRRLRRGGVGFFNDPGERSILHWVSISERESFLQRFLSFSFLVHPSAWPLEQGGAAADFDGGN
jgi:hypothetical protein